MKLAGAITRPEQIQFFLRLQGLWEGIIRRPPPPPFDIGTFEPIEPPWQAIKEWNPDDEPDTGWFNQTSTSQGSETQLDDGQTLILEYA